MKKILWIVNILLTPISTELSGKPSCGVWIEPLAESFKNSGEYSLTVAAAAKISKTVSVEKDGIKYCALPDNFPILYNENNFENIKVWKNLIEEEKPDLIHVWGTEFTHALCALRQAKDIPAVIYMQGYIGSIARHYAAGMTRRELRKSVTLRDIIKMDSIAMQQKKYFAHAQKEKEMFNLAGRIISENEWCNLSVESVYPEIKTYSCPLSVNRIFAEYYWDAEKAEKHSIICNASGYPLKGLHMILKAVSVLKEKYDDIKLYVPGPRMVSDGSVKGVLRKRGYTKYIEKLIKELGVEKHVVWLGNLPQKELAESYAAARVFVLGSSIENHSSSLKEAMMVGVPCVASAVGGIPEYIRHGENGFLYRFEEYEIMAKYIEMLFEDDDLAQKFSDAGRNDMRRLHEEKSVFEKICGIYRSIMEEK